MPEHRIDRVRAHPRALPTMGVLEYIIGGAAVLISAISLALAISANRTQERLLAASTWPFLQYYTGNRADDGSSSIGFSLQNAGVGPARVRSVQVEYGGHMHPDARSLLDACCASAGKPVRMITSAPERVLTAAEVVTFFRFDEAEADPDIWERLNTERFNVLVRACYCSVLGDCWMYDSRVRDAAALSTCPTISEDDRWHG